MDVQAALDEAYLAAAAAAESEATATAASVEVVSGIGIREKVPQGAGSSSTGATGSSSAEGSTVGLVGLLNSTDSPQQRNSLLLLSDTFTSLGSLVSRSRMVYIYITDICIIVPLYRLSVCFSKIT